MILATGLCYRNAIICDTIVQSVQSGRVADVVHEA
jgi:hypothetical protein